MNMPGAYPLSSVTATAPLPVYGTGPRSVQFVPPATAARLPWQTVGYSESGYPVQRAMSGFGPYSMASQPACGCGPGFPGPYHPVGVSPPLISRVPSTPPLIQPISSEVPAEVHPPANPRPADVPPVASPENVAALGRLLFFEAALSHPGGQSCATCHTPEAGFADPDDSLPVSRGALSDRVGSRNTPTAAYASFSPPLHYDAEGETYVGGLFLDGRASSLSEQAQGPLLNPLEMNNDDKAMVLSNLKNSGSIGAFLRVHGQSALSQSDPASAEAACAKLADAIAAFERSAELNSFTSKFDASLRGRVTLTAEESQGLELFNGKANCSACHPSTVTGSEPGPLFTDFTYDNVGIPKNQASPFLALSKDLNPDGPDFIDHGLATTVARLDPARAQDQDGKFKVPTLRNVGLTAPYGHNGYFRTLKEIVHFYNTRDLADAKWPPAEVLATVNHEELGDLKLTDQEEDALVAFLLTLSDG